MKLYSYFRSSASYRVRIVLQLKKLDYEYIALDVRKNDHHSKTYLNINPQGLLPTLVDEGKIFTQSTAIIEYLEETYPKPALLPKDTEARAYVRALSQHITCEIHPLNNLRTLKYLKTKLGKGEDDVNTWYRDWIAAGFETLESMLLQGDRTGIYCLGNQVTVADAYLVPQVYNARRFNCDLSAYPTICRIDAALQTLPEVQKAAPENQPDCDL